MDPAGFGKSVDQEIDDVNRERARIRELIGRIGGVRYSRIDSLVNLGFMVLVVGLFFLEITLHPFPATVSIGIGVFLVSMKIVWMIHANQRYNHFVFQVLNSIEFRFNADAKTLDEMARSLTALQDSRKEAPDLP